MIAVAKKSTPRSARSRSIFLSRAAVAAVNSPPSGVAGSTAAMRTRRASSVGPTPAAAATCSAERRTSTRDERSATVRLCERCDVLRIILLRLRGAVLGRRRAALQRLVRGALGGARFFGNDHSDDRVQITAAAGATRQPAVAQAQAPTARRSRRDRERDRAV